MDRCAYRDEGGDHAQSTCFHASCDGAPPNRKACKSHTGANTSLFSQYAGITVYLLRHHDILGKLRNELYLR